MIVSLILDFDLDEPELFENTIQGLLRAKQVRHKAHVLVLSPLASIDGKQETCRVMLESVFMEQHSCRVSGRDPQGQ